MNINDFPPGKALYLKVRGGFVAQGSTLTGWCRENDINPTNARASLAGVWDGPKGRDLRAKLLVASGIVIHSVALNS